MNINRTFSIPEHTVRDLNRQVRNQSRSEFVAKAIRNRLDGELSYDISQEPIYRILTHLASREELTDSQRKVISNMMKELVN